MAASGFSERIYELLQSSDLDAVSVDMIQKQLEDNDGISLDQHKDEIESAFNKERQKLLAIRLENGSKQQQSDEPETAESKPNKLPHKPIYNPSRCYDMPQKLSAELEAFMGQKYAISSDAINYVLQYVNDNKMFNPDDSRYIICDKVLKTVLKTDSISLFNVDAAIARNMTDVYGEELDGAIRYLSME
ncbi:hypothetical protein IWW48_004356 [Coemansia sp. RSA 1200]|nr:hypothetical protein IWW48_004356 [Coemansia sp. RSA 1200]